MLKVKIETSPVIDVTFFHAFNGTDVYTEDYLLDGDNLVSFAMQEIFAINSDDGTLAPGSTINYKFGVDAATYSVDFT